MTAPFKCPIQNEPKPEIGIEHYNRNAIMSTCWSVCGIVHCYKDENKYNEDDWGYLATMWMVDHVLWYSLRTFAMQVLRPCRILHHNSKLSVLHHYCTHAGFRSIQYTISFTSLLYTIGFTSLLYTAVFTLLVCTTGYSPTFLIGELN